MDRMNNKGYVLVEASLYMPIMIYVTAVLILSSILMFHSHMTTVSGMQEAGREAAKDFCYDSSSPGFEYPAYQTLNSGTVYVNMNANTWGGRDASKSLIGSQPAFSGLRSGMGPVSYLSVSRNLFLGLSEFIGNLLGMDILFQVDVGYGTAVCMNPVDYSRQVDAARYYTKNPGDKNLSLVYWQVHKTSKYMKDR
ncbi:MAG: hypothetical protein K6E28_00055 [Eubacterium sp.]|nr:hypothetical protein [Eubacterium sp.]